MKHALFREEVCVALGAVDDDPLAPSMRRPAKDRREGRAKKALWDRRDGSCRDEPADGGRGEAKEPLRPTALLSACSCVLQSADEARHEPVLRRGAARGLDVERGELVPLTTFLRNVSGAVLGERTSRWLWRACRRRQGDLGLVPCKMLILAIRRSGRCAPARRCVAAIRRRRGRRSRPRADARRQSSLATSPALRAFELLRITTRDPVGQFLRQPTSTTGCRAASLAPRQLGHGALHGRCRCLALRRGSGSLAADDSRQVGGSAR